MYSYNDYLLAKANNSILERFEGLCDELRKLLCMPTAIAGLHSSYKHAVSGIERHIKDIVPRCVLTYSGLSLDKNACTSTQMGTSMRAVGPGGKYDDYVLPYRRLPLTAQFNLVVTTSNPAEAIRLTEYISMLSFAFPLCNGDEHTKSTMICSESLSIDYVQDKNLYNVSGSLQLNMQILEPMTIADEDNILYPLVGIGTQLPDGSWSDVSYGDIIKDEQGNPILGEDGKPLVGTYVEDGWYRLHQSIRVHAHRMWDECLENPATITWERPAGAETLGHVKVEKED